MTWLRDAKTGWSSAAGPVRPGSETPWPNREGKAGAGLWILSSARPDLFGLCDRIHVMHRGAIAARFAAGEANSDRLLAVATGAQRAQNEERPFYAYAIAI